MKSMHVKLQNHLQFCGIDLRRLGNTGMHQHEPLQISLFLIKYFFSVTKALAYYIIHKNFF